MARAGAERSPAGQCCDTFATLRCVCVPTYMRNTYPGVGSVLRTIIACRPEDSLRPVLSYPSSSLAIVPRQTHDHNPSFPFCRRFTLSLSLFLCSRFCFSLRFSAANLRSHSLSLSLSLSSLSFLSRLKKPLVGSSSGSQRSFSLLFFSCLAAYRDDVKKE